MYQIELILRSHSRQEDQIYLFPIPVSYVYLLKTYLTHLGENLQALLQVGEEENQTIAVLDSADARDRDFFRSLKSELLALSDSAEQDELPEISGESLSNGYQLQFLADDRETLEQFIEWCEENHRMLVTFLFGNDFFDNQ
ncbi:hypothetical protein Pan110_18070 [Gimesia panareensis]|nr:hypothetical protein Pan110_18070 [Gimesia panareensis]